MEPTGPKPQTLNLRIRRASWIALKFEPPRISGLCTTHLSYSLNSFKGGLYRGLYQELYGEHYRDYYEAYQEFRLYLSSELLSLLGSPSVQRRDSRLRVPVPDKFLVFRFWVWGAHVDS